MRAIWAELEASSSNNDSMALFASTAKQRAGPSMQQTAIENSQNTHAAAGKPVHLKGELHCLLPAAKRADGLVLAEKGMRCCLASE